ncbi:MAG: DNA polymerase III subunit gamma/tau [Saprospiraceae bacterium]|nr:DNA polymerase III subunit gamma/tau [Saprospiraceae bacterium]
MSQFVVSARKYRPSRFEDVVGQEHVSKTLKNALQTGHLAHAFLFCGPRGVGKTTCARILAKVINCQNTGADFEPCNTCDSCRAFNDNASFNITELDAASNNSVDAMRALIDQVRFQPQQGKYKVFIIDEVHMLSAQAFNAFLKTLEEPPPYAIFILATTEKHKIIPTILSRCQIYDFRRIQVQDTVKHLQHICAQEGIEADEAALHIIGQKADGALRDALSIFDRMVAAGGNRIRYEAVLENLNVLDYDYYFRVVDGLLSEDLAQVLLLFDEVSRRGFDPDIFILGLAEHLRNLLVCKDEATLALLETGESLRERYRAQARLAPAALLLSALNLANECDLHYKMARNKRLHTEMALIKMTYIQRALRRTPFTATEEDPEKKNPDGSEQRAKGIEHRGDALSNVEEEKAIGQLANGQLVNKQQATDASTSLSIADNSQPATHASTPLSTSNSQPATLNEPDPEPYKREAPVLKGSDKYSIAKLSSLASMLEDQLKPADATANGHTHPFTEAELRTAWMLYAEDVKSDSVKTYLRGVQLNIEHDNIVATVGSNLAESSIRQEPDLIEFLRQRFQKRELALHIKVQRDESNTAPQRAAPLNDREKLLQMRQANPLVQEVWERLGLTLEQE